MKNQLYTPIKENRLFFIIVLLFLGMSVSSIAQVPQVERNAPPMEQLPQEQNQLAITYDDEIKEDELPEQVTSSIIENYPGYEIAKVFRGSDGSYKVNLEKEEEKLTAYYAADGEFIRVEKEIDDETINDDWR